MGIEQEIKAIESMEPTKVVGISLNLRNFTEDKSKADIFSECEKKYMLPAVDIFQGGASILLDAITEYIEYRGH